MARLPQLRSVIAALCAAGSLSCSKPSQQSVTAPGNTQPTQPTVACQFEVSPVERIALPLAETAEFSITTTSGCAWRIENVPDWVTVNGARSGSGSATVRYEVTRNPTPVANRLREAPLEVRWDTPTAGQNVWVRQMPLCSMLVYDPATNTNISTYRAPAAGGRVAFWTLVDSPFSCPWSARSEADWLTFDYPVYPAMSRGDGGIAFNIAPNTTGTERVGRVQVAEVYLTVIQPAR